MVRRTGILALLVVLAAVAVQSRSSRKTNTGAGDAEVTSAASIVPIPETPHTERVPDPNHPSEPAVRSQSAAATPASVPSGPAPIRGLMAFGWGPNYPRSLSLTMPYVDGITAYYGWNELEPNKGQYDFSEIDSLVAWARSNNKIVNIGIYPGSHSPDWLYTAGAASFSWQRPLKEDVAKARGSATQTQKTPLPWDRVYIQNWIDFIKVVGQRYGEAPGVGYIGLTGPTIRDLSSGILLRGEDWNRFVAAGFTVEKIGKAWEQVIDAYEQAMPNTRLVLAVGMLHPGSNDVTVPQNIISYVKRKGYSNIGYLCVFLNDTWFLNGGGSNRIRELLQGAKRDGHPFGYQLVQSVRRNDSWESNEPIVRDLRQTLKIGMDDGADWIEVWHVDIVAPGSSPSAGQGQAQGQSQAAARAPDKDYSGDLAWAHQKLTGH